MAGLAAACVGTVGEGDDAEPQGGGGAVPGVPRATLPGAGAGLPGTPGVPGPAGGAGAGGLPTPGPSAPAAAERNGVGPRPLRRLTNEEYNNTVRDLLGVTVRPADGFVADDRADSGFLEATRVTADHARRFSEAAQTLAGLAVKSLPALTGCDPKQKGEDECLTRLVVDLGRRIYRRPVDDAEAANQRSLYKKVRAELGYGHDEAMRVVLTAMLQSPYFLYHWEGAGPRGDRREGAAVRLGAYRVASLLSYFLWASMPDAALFAAAEGGALDTPDGIRAQVKRMLADRKARESVVSFHRQWLDEVVKKLGNVSKDAKLYPGFDAIKGSLGQELDAFTAHVMLDGDARVESLYAASFSFVNEALGKIYGVTGVKGTALVKTELPREERAGLLTQAAYLAVGGNAFEGSPVRRGVPVIRTLLCKSLPPAPPDLNAVPPKFDATRTTRERFAQHAADPACAACHKLIDSVGFAFESYDGIGRFVKGRDSSGSLELDGTARTFKSARELADLMAGSDEAARCVATQWLRYGLGRRETPADQGSFEAAFAAFKAQGRDLREFLAALASSRAFTHRAPHPDEVLP